MESIKYFFSYSRQNSEFVIKLATDLKQAGANVWLDQIDIAPGMRWDDAIQKALNDARGILIVLSADSVKSQNVMDEVSYAISQQKQIVPLVMEDCEIPFRLARYQYIDFKSNYVVALEQLLSTLKAKETNSESIKPDSKIDNEYIKDRKSVEKAKLKTNLESNDTSIKSLIFGKGSKIAGILFIVLAVVITLINKCLTNAQYFIIYALIGIGIALLLARSASKSKANIKLLNMVIVLSGGVVLPFILFFTNPIGQFKPDGCNPKTSATVFVHGKMGKQDMILRQKGYVIMDVNNERKKESINENGQAFFPNLNIGDNVRLEIDFSEPYHAINPDSVYVIQPNSNIYLPVELQGIDNVRGSVMFNDAPLEGVIVKLEGKTGDLFDTTKYFGEFSFNIPEKMQKNDYTVWFIKEGFKAKSAPAFPQTGQRLEIVMEKK